jgi:hypothetical protein
MRNRIFHQVRIGGMTFDGVLTGDGPYLSCQTSGGVALGVCGLRHFRPVAEGARHTPPHGWWVVKYQDEERIFLPGFDRATIRTLSDEFGLPVLTERGFDPFNQERRDYFFTSPAWEALRQWVTRHPRLARTHAACDPYLRGWYGRALSEAALFPLESATAIDFQRLPRQPGRTA